MAIRPSPRTYQCSACRWRKTVHPSSDVLMPGDRFTHCPECGALVFSTKPTLLDMLLAGFDTLFRPSKMNPPWKRRGPF